MANLILVVGEDATTRIRSSTRVTLVLRWMVLGLGEPI